MAIRLKIENVERLANNGPTVFDATDSSFDIGREDRDWNLPDPEMFISGRHCEIRYDNGSYWLHDVSRNGTFVNGSNQRINGPHRLNTGDRLRIGRYVVAVAIAPLQAGASAAPSAQTYDPQVRGGNLSAPPRDQPLDPRALSFEDDAFLKSSGPADMQPRATEASAFPHAGGERSGFANSAAPQPQPLGQSEFLRIVAAGAGVSPEVFLRRDEREVAFEMGAVLRTVVDELALLLKARAAAKVLAKSSHRTMIGSADNNPLKFLPSAEEILEVMFVRRRPGYLDAKHSFEDAFRDLKTHEIATYSAMQAALGRLLDDLSPEAIEKKLPASAFSSKKARAWEAFVTTWETKEAAHENGMLDVFLAYFSEAYAKATKPKP